MKKRNISTNSNQMPNFPYDVLGEKFTTKYKTISNTNANVNRIFNIKNYDMVFSSKKKKNYDMICYFHFYSNV